MSEIEMIYQALEIHPTAVIYKDDDEYVLQVDFIDYKGKTIGDAIRNYYEAIEKESEKAE